MLQSAIIFSMILSCYLKASEILISLNIYVESDQIGSDQIGDSVYDRERLPPVLIYKTLGGRHALVRSPSESDQTS